MGNWCFRTKTANFRKWTAYSYDPRVHSGDIVCYFNRILKTSLRDQFVALAAQLLYADGIVLVDEYNRVRAAQLLLFKTHSKTVELLDHYVLSGTPEERRLISHNLLQHILQHPTMSSVQTFLCQDVYIRRCPYMKNILINSFNFIPSDIPQLSRSETLYLSRPVYGHDTKIV